MNKKINITLVLFLASFAILVGEALYLSQSVDAYGLIQSNQVSGWQRWFGYLGVIARGALTLITAFAIIRHKRFTLYWESLKTLRATKLTPFCGVLQIGIFLGLLVVTNGIFSTENINTKPTYWYLLWLILAASTTIIWALMWFSPSGILAFIKNEKFALLISLALAIAVTTFASHTSALWGPMASVTFYLVALILLLIGGGEVNVITEDRVIGLNDFWINIAPVCSGYEGIGLISAFLALFIFLQRNQLRFPHCLILFPIGIFLIWVLNILRIVLLVIIGAHWSPEIAVGGFHSFGGWITFLLVSIWILWVASNNAWINKQELSESPTKTGLTLPMATLVPIVVLLASTILTSALSADFDWLYPIRFFSVAAAIIFIWRSLGIKSFALKPEPFIVGFLVAGLWYLMVPSNPEYNNTFEANLATQSGAVVFFWLVIRFAGAVVTVPIAEELAFRGYLLCRAAKIPVELDNKIPFNAIGLALSSIAFGLLHGDWVAGIVAGLAYGWVRIRSENIIAPIAAHATTNAALFAVAAMTGQWVLI